MLDQLVRIYGAVVGDPASLFFCLLIVGWLGLGLALAIAPNLARRGFSARFVAMTPTSLATLGVLGTFYGILLGLLDFDVSRVDQSVPNLLEGMKIAFVTSIFGIVAAVVFRLVRVFFPGPASETGTTPDAIHATLRDMLTAQRDSGKQSSDQLVELRRAISSDGDGSLLTQIQKLRTTVQDGHEQQIKEFRDFAKHMVENNQKAFIQALEGVIRDFNKNLTEQFGENFKELNRAVGALVKWQDKYREHVEALEKRLETAVGAMEASSVALASIREHADRIPQAIKPLEPVLAGLESQIQVLDAHLAAIANLRDKAVEAFPIIETNLQKVTEDFKAVTSDLVASTRKVVTEGQSEQARLREEHSAFLAETRTARDAFAKELSAALKAMSEQAARQFAEHGALIDASVKRSEKAIDDAWSKTAVTLNEKFAAFDKLMQDEMTRALALMGRQLASVSEKFVSDYTPLTEKLRDLVSVARRAS